MNKTEQTQCEEYVLQKIDDLIVSALTEDEKKILKFLEENNPQAAKREMIFNKPKEVQTPIAVNRRTKNASASSAGICSQPVLTLTESDDELLFLDELDWQEKTTAALTTTATNEDNNIVYPTNEKAATTVNMAQLPTSITNTHTQPNLTLKSSLPEKRNNKTMIPIHDTSHFAVKENPDIIYIPTEKKLRTVDNIISKSSASSAGICSQPVLTADAEAQAKKYYKKILEIKEEKNMTLKEILSTWNTKNKMTAIDSLLRTKIDATKTIEQTQKITKTKAVPEEALLKAKTALQEHSNSLKKAAIEAWQIKQAAQSAWDELLLQVNKKIKLDTKLIAAEAQATKIIEKTAIASKEINITTPLPQITGEKIQITQKVQDNCHQNLIRTANKTKKAAIETWQIKQPAQSACDKLLLQVNKKIKLDTKLIAAEAQATKIIEKTAIASNEINITTPLPQITGEKIQITQKVQDNCHQNLIRTANKTKKAVKPKGELEKPLKANSQKHDTKPVKYLNLAPYPGTSAIEKYNRETYPTDYPTNYPRGKVKTNNSQQIRRKKASNLNK